MWSLKIQHSHKDCLYAKQLNDLNLTMYGYPLSFFIKNGKFFLCGIQMISGDQKKVQGYIYYVKSLKNIQHFEILTSNAFLFQASINKNISYYKKIYTQKIIYLSPVIHEKKRETFEVASWDRKLLEEIINNIKSNKNTNFFKLLHLKRKISHEIFIPQILPKLTLNQRDLIKIAKDNGYWQYPRKINLTQLADLLNINKSSIHERLRRVESKIMDFFI